MKLLKYISRILICIVILGILAFGRKVYNNYSQKGNQTINVISKDIIISELHSISKLETAEIEISKTINAETELGDWYEGSTIDDYFNKLLFQDSMEFSLTGRVVAGINLENIQESDIKINLDGSVSITLPQAEILYVKIDESNVSQRDLGLLVGGGNINMETEVRKSAEEQLRQEAIDNGILQAANENAYSTLKNILKKMNIELKIGKITELI